MAVRAGLSPLMMRTSAILPSLSGRRLALSISISSSRSSSSVRSVSSLLTPWTALAQMPIRARPASLAVPSSLLLPFSSRHVMISAALLTTHSNTSARTTSTAPSLMGAPTLRSQRLLPRPSNNKLPSLLLPASSPLGAIATFSSKIPKGGGGAPVPKGGGRMGMAGMVTAGAVLLGKGKYILGALKLTKLSSLASMFITIGAYSMIFGVPYAIGIVGLILVHECGHALVMNHYKIPFSPMVFLPFMGAVIAMKDQPKDAWQDAIIAFGGPVLGTVGAAGVALSANLTDSQLLYALADFGYMVNLFNMMPLGSMDGGRITGALSPYAGVVGLGMGGGLLATGTISNPIMYLIMLAGGWSTFQRFYDPGQLPPHYYDITSQQRGILGGCYFGLIGVIVAGMSLNAVNKKPVEELKGYQELSFDEREF